MHLHLFTLFSCILPTAQPSTFRYISSATTNGIVLSKVTHSTSVAKYNRHINTHLLCPLNAANWFLLTSPTKLLIQNPSWAHPYGALSAFFQQVAKTNLKNNSYSPFCLFHYFIQLLINYLPTISKLKISKTQRFSHIHFTAKSARKWLKVINSLSATYLL